MFLAEGIRAEVYSADGKLIWSGEGQGNRLDWEPRSEEGLMLPWGPYIYCLYGRLEGDWKRVECSLLFVAEIN